MTDAFITYTPDTADFARRLAHALHERGYPVFPPNSAAPPPLAWDEATCRKLEPAPNVLFPISNAALADPIAHQLLAHARRYHKRVIPLTRQPPDTDFLLGIWQRSDWEETAHDNWRFLHTLDWLPFEDDAHFDEQLSALLDRLRDNLEGARTHAELLTRARDWERHDHDPALLLTETDLYRAQLWLARAAQDGPPPATLHRRFLQASLVRQQSAIAARHETAAAQQHTYELRLGVMMGLVLVTIIGLLLLALDYDLSLNRMEDARTAEANAQRTALAAALDATVANDILQDMQRRQSHMLADLAQAELASGAQHNALTLSLEAMQGYPVAYHPAALGALQDTLAYPAQEIYHLPFSDGLQGGRWNRDETWLLAWTNQTIQIINIGNPSDRITLPYTSLSNEPFEISGVQRSRDENLLLAWASDGTARVWDLRQPANPLVFQHPDRVFDAGWNADETRLLTLGADGQLRVWQTLNPDAEPLTVAQAEALEYARWSADGTHILAYGGAALHWWNLQSPAQSLSFDHNSAIGGARLNAAQTQILTWDDSAVYVWAIDNPGEARHRFPTDSPTSSARWVEDDAAIIAFHGETISRWQLDQPAQADYAVAHGLPVDRVEWRPDGAYALTWDDSGPACAATCRYRARVWHLAGDVPQLAKTLTFREPVTGAAWSPNGRGVATWSADGTLQVTHTSAGPPIILRQEGAIRHAAWNAAGSRLLVTAADNTLRLWDLLNLRSRPGLPAEDELLALDWSADRQRAVYVTRNGPPRLFDWQHPDRTVSFSGATGRHWLAVRLSPDESRLLARTAGDEIVVWAIDGPDDPRILRHPARVSDAHWHTDSQQVIAQSGNDVFVWDANADVAPLRFQADLPVRGAALNPAGTRLAARYAGSNAVAVWSLAALELTPLTLDHGGPVQGLAWGPAGRLFTWADDFTLRRWNLESPAVPLLYLQDKPVRGAILTPDGTRILTWAGDNTLHVWATADPNAPQHTLQLQLAGPLPPFAITRAAWSPDGSRVLISISNGQAAIWNLEAPDMPPYIFDRWESRVTWDEGGNLLLWHPTGTVFEQRVDMLKVESVLGLQVFGQQRVIRGQDNPERARAYRPTLAPTWTPRPSPTLAPTRGQPQPTAGAP